MLVVNTIARIRRAHFVDGKSIKQLTREFDLARNTVRRVLRSGETAFSYERAVQPRPKLGAWTETLDRRLAANDRLSSRERLDLVRIYEDIRAEGFDGGYDTVRRYAQARQRKRGTGSCDAYVPLSYAPGKAYQFDWSTEVVVLHGTTTIVQVAQVRLCHSRMPLVRAYPRQAQEMVFDAHDKAFSFYKGACPLPFLDTRSYTRDERGLVGSRYELHDEVLQAAFTAVRQASGDFGALILARIVPMDGDGRVGTSRTDLDRARGSQRTTLEGIRTMDAKAAELSRAIDDFDRLARDRIRIASGAHAVPARIANEEGRTEAARRGLKLEGDAGRGGVPQIVSMPRMTLRLAPFAATPGRRLDPGLVAEAQLRFPPSVGERVKADTDGTDWWSCSVRKGGPACPTLKRPG